MLLLGTAYAGGLVHALLLFRAGIIDLGAVIAYFGLLRMLEFPTFTSTWAYSQISSGLSSARRILELIKAVPADREGVFHASVDRDAHVAKGAKVGFVTDYLNRPLQDVVAPEAGIVMFIRAVPSLKKGDTMVNIGVVSTQAR